MIIVCCISIVIDETFFACLFVILKIIKKKIKLAKLPAAGFSTMGSLLLIGQQNHLTLLWRGRWRIRAGWWSPRHAVLTLLFLWVTEFGSSHFKQSVALMNLMKKFSVFNGGITEIKSNFSMIFWFSDQQLYLLVLRSKYRHQNCRTVLVWNLLPDLVL